MYKTHPRQQALVYQRAEQEQKIQDSETFTDTMTSSGKYIELLQTDTEVLTEHRSSPFR